MKIFTCLTLSAFLCCAAPVLLGATPAAKKPAPAKPAPPKISNQEVSKKLNGIYDKYSERIQNTDIWKRDYKKIQAEYADFLKNPDLNEEQKLTIVSRMATNGLDMGGGEYEKQMEVLAKFADCPAKTKIVYDIIVGHIKSKKRWRFKLADSLYPSYEAKFSVDQKITLLSMFTNAALSIENNPEKFNTLLKQIIDMPVPADMPPKAQEKVKAQKGRAVCDALLALIKYDVTMGDKFFKENIASFGDAEILTIRQAFLMAAIEAQDRAEFDAHLKEIRKFPFSPAKFNAFLAAAKAVHKRSMPVANALLKEVSAWKELTPEQTLSVKMMYVGFAGCPTGFSYDAYPLKSYEKAKAALLDAGKFAAANAETLKKSRVLKEYYLTALAHFYVYGDFELFEKTLAEAKALYPDDINIMNWEIANHIRKGNRAAAIEILKGVIANPKLKNHAEMNSYLLIFLENPADKAIALCNKIFDEKKYNSSKRLDIFRETSRTLFNFKMFDAARTIHMYVITEMFKKPPTDHVYTVKFVERNVPHPQSADAFAKSKYYDNWDAMETRFYATSVYDMDGTHDKKNFLKDAPEQPLDDAYRMGVYILCNEDGVHFFIRGNDPKIDEVRLGTREGAGTLEVTLRPDDGAAYHWWLMGPLPKVDDKSVINWSGPSKHYRPTYDFLTKDCVLTQEGFVVHNFVPWAMCYDNLPFEGHTWKYGLVASTPSSRTISGKHHDMSRAIQLKFELTPAQIFNLRKRIALYEFNRYSAIRKNGGEVIQTWNDDALGDPEFYKAEVEPLINELDAAGKKLQENFNTISEAELNEFYQKYVPVWAEIKYVLADKRAAYLRKQLLK